MAVEFSYCPRIKVDGSSLLSGVFKWKAFSSEGSKRAKSKYEDDVLAVLKKLYDDTWTATAVIDAVFTAGLGHNAYVVIEPMGASSTLASAGPNKPEDAAPPGAVRYSGRRDDPTTPKDERAETLSGKGTGAGSSSRIEFNPHSENPEKTIVHELVHALREMRGQFNQVPTETVLAEYENEEEFYAMLVANILLSERGREDLRASHIVYQELTAAQKTSEGFLADTDYGKACRRLVNKFTIDDPDVANFIKNHVPIATKFNPIREFLMHTDKYPLA